MPPITAWLSDMDGVLVKENRALPGAQQFLDALKRKEMPFLVLTNNSIFTNRDLSARLKRSGLSVPEERIWTSANATAAFLSQQSPASTAYVIGEAGLTTALHGASYVMTDQDPEYVVLGETRTYDFNTLTRAIRLIEAGAKFIATNRPVAQRPTCRSRLSAVLHGAQRADPDGARLHPQAGTPGRRPVSSSPQWHSYETLVPVSHREPFRGAPRRIVYYEIGRASCRERV